MQRLRMKLDRYLPVTALAIALACGGAPDRGAQPDAESELAQLYADDQADRQRRPLPRSRAELDSMAAALEARDSTRRVRVREMLAQRSITTADGYFRAAMIINHGHDSSSYKAANALVRNALAVDSTHRGAAWLDAVTMDNLRTSRGEPSWYTIKIRGTPNERPRIQPFDSTRVTDAERVRLGFDSLVTQRRNLNFAINSWKPLP
jgi:hypothetical protein